jgi:predicted RNA-binding protein with PUA-like domain
MKKGDLVLYYHSNEGKDVVGIAKITRESYQDPTTPDDRWVVVDLEPVKPMKESVTLQVIKQDPKLADVALVKQSRLSVMPIEKRHFDRILELGNTRVR